MGSFNVQYANSIPELKAKNPTESTVLDLVDADNERYEKYKKRREALHEVLKPVLNVVGELAETAGEAVALVVSSSPLSLLLR